MPPDPVVPGWAFGVAVASMQVAVEALKVDGLIVYDSINRKRTLAPVYWGSGPPGTAVVLRVNPFG